MTPPERSLAVIGGGIVGLACALRLQAARYQVTVIDDDRDVQAASWGNAGHIATEQGAPLAAWANVRTAPLRLFALGGPLDFRRPWALRGWVLRYLAACAPQRYRTGCNTLQNLLAEAMPAWRTFAQELGATDLLHESGHIVCWGTARAARKGKVAWQAADLGTASLIPLEPGWQEHLQRILTHAPAGALAFAGTGQIADHLRLRELAQRRFSALGGQCLTGTAERLEQMSSGSWRVNLTDAGEVTARQVVVCAGVRSVELLKPLGWRTPIVAERGYHLHWSEHDWPQDLPPVVFEDRSVIATRFEHGLRLAGFVEYAPRATPPDPRKWEALARHARELGLPVRGTPQRWFGARPTLPDYLPAIGPLPGHEGMFCAFGHQHLGLTLAPITAQRIEAMMQKTSA